MYFTCYKVKFIAHSVQILINNLPLEGKTENWNTHNLTSSLGLFLSENHLMKTM